MEIVWSATRHGITEEDIRHAIHADLLRPKFYEFLR